DSHQLRGKSRSKSRGGRLKCYIRQSEDYLKRNRPKNNRKKSSGYVNKDDQPSSSGSIYDSSEVMMVMSAEALLDWIMDSVGLFYLELEGIIVYTLWMAMQWQVSLMLVLKKKTVLHRFGIKDWDISVRRDTGAGKAGSVWQEES
nr:zinc finger, CCHC-type [Tanacetum cinerariifolium]